MIFMTKHMFANMYAIAKFPFLHYSCLSHEVWGNVE